MRGQDGKIEAGVAEEVEVRGQDGQIEAGVEEGQIEAGVAEDVAGRGQDSKIEAGVVREVDGVSVDVEGRRDMKWVASRSLTLVFNTVFYIICTCMD